jgi:hypothetical protein
MIGIIEEYARANMLSLQEEMDRIGRLTRHLEALRVEAALDRPESTSRAALAELGRLVDLMLLDDADRPAVGLPAPRFVAPSSGTLPGPSRAVPGHECLDARPVSRRVVCDPVPAHRAEASSPAGDDDSIHDLISRRIEQMQSERRGRWQKILDLVAGQ